MTTTAPRTLRVPSPPTFDSVEEERAHRKTTLAVAFRMFSKAGLDEGVAGHVTVRDPEFPHTFWVNPFGLHFAMIRSSDLVRVDEAGEVVEGDRAVNQAPPSRSTAPCTPPAPTSWLPRTLTGPTARRCRRWR